MKLNDYQAEARKTAIYTKNASGIERLYYSALGLVGEAGEFANKVKKIIRDGGSELLDTETDPFAIELGDTLWYVADNATNIGWTLEDIAKLNLERLADRAERGKIGGAGDDR